MDIYKGKLKGFRGSWESGLGYLLIEDNETGSVDSIPCDNGPTVRALEACFGNAIDKAHTVKCDQEAGFYDKEVYWSYDDFGLTLAGFTPVDEAPDKIVEYYEKERV